MRAKFNEQLKEAEQARHQKAIEEPTTFLGRMQKRSMRWIAERIADQRLLWHLRKVDAATLHASSDLAAAKPTGSCGQLEVGRRSSSQSPDPASLALIAAVPVALVPGRTFLAICYLHGRRPLSAWRGAVRACTRSPGPLRRVRR
jgi:hypothetical protein